MRKNLLTDDQGQATTEYILLLAIVVAVFVVVARDLIKPMMALLTKAISGALTDQLFNSRSFHNFRLRR